MRQDLEEDLSESNFVLALPNQKCLPIGFWESDKNF